MSNNTEYVTETSRCLQIVARLEREIVVAVATEGVNTGKEGPLTLVQIGTCSGAVYVFDILENRELMSKGRLRTILESDKIKKVMSHMTHLAWNVETTSHQRRCNVMHCIDVDQTLA